MTSVSILFGSKSPREKFLEFEQQQVSDSTDSIRSLQHNLVEAYSIILSDGSAKLWGK